MPTVNGDELSKYRNKLSARNNRFASQKVNQFLLFCKHFKNSDSSQIINNTNVLFFDMALLLEKDSLDRSSRIK